MTKEPIKGLPASIHQRLLNLDPERTHDFTPVLRRYAFERWLYRLGKSRYAGQFAMKGAMLLVLWTGDQSRTTLDLDLLGMGNLTEADLRKAFTIIGQTVAEPDGVIFITDAMVVEPIREGAEYHGLRTKFSARLGNIRIPLQVDIGIGGRVWPQPEFVLYPTLLDLPAPHVQACQRETTIAEKFDAMLNLGMVNSRMKDFYDIATLGDMFSFKGQELQKALQTTLKGKGLRFSGEPLVFSSAFALDSDKKIQWAAFLRRIGKDPRNSPFPRIVEKIKRFLSPLLTSLMEGREFKAFWPPGGPWRAEKDTKDR